MENTELPVLLEDFEVADRIYWARYSSVKMGTVTSSCYGLLVVQFDDESYRSFTAQELAASNDSSGSIGNPLDLDLVEVGGIISHLIEDNEREYADVLSYIPETELAYRVQDRDAIIVVKENDYSPTIEQQMFDWEVEG